MDKAVIFDMDGVIFDSERANYECWAEITKKHGVYDFEVPYMKSIGTTNDATRQLFFEYYGPDFPYDTCRREASELYHSLYDGGRLPTKEGILELAVYLKANGFCTAVASSTRSAVVRSQLEAAGLMPYFDCIVGGEMVSKSKPAPDVFLKAAESIPCHHNEIYVIEDSYNGIRAASAAGMIPIMIPDMLEPDDEMRRTAAHIFSSLNEFRYFLDAQA